MAWSTSSPYVAWTRRPGVCGRVEGWFVWHAAHPAQSPTDSAPDTRPIICTAQRHTSRNDFSDIVFINKIQSLLAGFMARSLGMRTSILGIHFKHYFLAFSGAFLFMFDILNIYCTYHSLKSNGIIKRQNQTTMSNQKNNNNKINS